MAIDQGSRRRKMNDNIIRFLLNANLFFGILCGVLVFVSAYMTILYHWSGIFVMIINGIASLSNIKIFLEERKNGNI